MINTDTNYKHGKNYLEMGIYSDNFGSNTGYDSIQTQMRLGFIRKVLGILGAQLLTTVIFCTLSMTSKSFLEFQIQNIGFFILCLIGSIIIPIIMVCFETTLRKVPTNYIMLSLFTFFESYIVSFICGMSNPHTVLMAACMTFLMVISLTLYAFYTKTDFSMQGGALFIFGCGFLMLSFFGIFTQNKFFHIFLCVIGIILFGFYIIYDIQIIVGNKAYLLDMDEYILASLMLYTDIISLFLKILQLLQLLGNNN